MQGTNWLFTINNPTWEDDPLKWPGVKFIAFQKERGDETGTEHFQGYVQFKVNKRLAACKALHLTAHWELRKGTHEQAKAYCTKEDTRIDGPWIEGVEPAPAKRNDLSLCMADVKAGMTEVELAEKYEGTWARNHNALSRYRMLCTKPRKTKTHVTVLFGPTGTGKSRSAFEGFPDAYPKPKGEWWDGYDSHPEVVIDEFYGWLAYDFLLRLTDRNPLFVPFKGGFKPFTSSHIVFTSNEAPEDWYKRFSFAPLLRRLDCIVFIDHQGVADVRRGTPPFPLNTSASPEPGPRDRVAELFAAYDAMPRNASRSVPDENDPPPNRALEHFFHPRG